MVFQFRGGENHDENYTGSKLQTGNQLFWKKEHLSNTHNILHAHTSLLQNVFQRKSLHPNLFINTCTGKKVQFPSVEGSNLFHHGSGTALTSLRYTIAAISTFLALYYVEASHGVLW